MPFSRIAEQRIREAIEQGHFENLSNAGQRLDLDEYFNAPAELRMAYSILKNANCAPVEVELMREIERLKTAILVAVDGEARQALERGLVDHQTRLVVLLERRRPGEK